MPPLKVSAILAIDALGGVARDGKLPWSKTLEGRWDMRHFVETTRGCTVVMGRATWETLEKPLPGRSNLVLTRNPDYQAEGASVVHTTAEALDAVGADGELWVIGGPSTYEAFRDIVDTWVITRFDKAYFCTTHYMPTIQDKKVVKTVNFEGGQVSYVT